MNLAYRQPPQVSGSSGLPAVPQSPVSDHAYMNVSVTGPQFVAPGAGEADQRRPNTLAQALRLQSQTSRPLSPDTLGVGASATGPGYSVDAGQRPDTDTHSHSPFASATSSTPSPAAGGALPTRSRNELDRQSPRCVAPHITLPHLPCRFFFRKSGFYSEHRAYITYGS